MNTVKQFPTSENPDVVIGGEPPVLVPSGLYDLSYSYHETKLYGSGQAPKVVIWFKIMGPQHRDIELACYYAVESLCGKPKKYGRFRLAGYNSRFLRDYVSVLGKPDRWDRITPRHYEGRIIQGEVITVTTGWDKQDIPLALQYSTIKSIVWLIE